MESTIEVTSRELARHSATVCVVGDQLYVWGGDGDAVDLNTIYMLDLNNCKRWRKVHTEIRGNPKKSLLRAFGTECNQRICVVGDVIYVYGGIGSSSYSNMLCKLCLKEMIWHEIVPINPRDGPGKKHMCGMVEHDGKICIFGGYGHPTDHQKENKLFSKNPDEFFYQTGWTSELHLFDPVASKLAFSILSQSIFIVMLM